jgi:hypothetical protein
MFHELTAELLDLTARARGELSSYFAAAIDCCSCSCCWN